MAAAWVVLVLTAFTVAAGAVHAAPVVGSASTIVRDVRGMLDRDWRTIVIDDNVFQDEVIRTGKGSAARLIFADRTDFMIGANSEVVLDKFVYDPTNNSGQLLLRATKGLMKFRTGSMSSRSYRIETPVATVGVRGTEFVVKIYEGVTTIQVISGEVIVIDHDGHEVIVKPNERAVVFPPDHERASDGPILITGGDRAHELPEEVREMVAQVVFTEETGQTELTVEGDESTKVDIGNGGVSFGSLIGGGGAIQVKPSSQSAAGAKPPPGNGSSTPASIGTVPEDPLLAPSNQPPPPPPACVMFCFNSLNSLAGWTVTGGGSIATVSDPRGSGGLVMQLTTGSPITISQEIETTGNPFVIAFDYLFADQDGTLQVFLDEIMVTEIFADPAVTDFQTATIRVDDPDLFQREQILFQLTFDGELSDLRLMLDNLTGADLVDNSTNIPIMPSAIGLASGVAFLGWAAARRRRKADRTR